MDKQEAARILEEIALLLELSGENPFKVRAYENGARALLTLPGDLEEAVARGTLAKVKGIGKSLAGIVQELVEQGHARLHEELKEKIPPGLVALLQVPGLGPKKARQLYQELQIASLGELEYAIRENRLVSLPGFGAKTQEKLKAGLERVRRYAGLFRLGDLWPAAQALLAAGASLPALTRLEVAGGVRRGLEVERGLVFLAAADDPPAAVETLRRLPAWAGLEGTSEGRWRFTLPGGQEVSLSFSAPEVFGAAWLAHTGSEAHWQELVALAALRGLKLTAAGLLAGATLLPSREEADIYRALGLAFIPPELREGQGEIAAAAVDALPRLLTQEDLRGCFHVHSHFSDGVNSLPELVAAAQSRGWEYLGLTDHSQSAYYAGGLKPADLLRQQAEVAACRLHHPEFTLFWGIESDILGDGSLDYPPELLEGFDFVIASIHSQFGLPKADMTRRLLTALANPATTMVGHVTGRLLLAREAYEADLEAILEAAARYGAIMELNASPYRLDLDWRWLRRARELGLMISINPDAHSLEGLDDVWYGVVMARKGWLSPEQVLNAYPAPEAARLLRRRRLA
jgi:DNA polymerase (family 10)